MGLVRGKMHGMTFKNLWHLVNLMFLLYMSKIKTPLWQHFELEWTHFLNIEKRLVPKGV